ncbi:MAG: dihydrodipicolinate synthase family protein, partial [Firmicutes bacterium]|nr:dihydrodipicolinate synthase family protein [Bacillota bacterium]
MMLTGAIAAMITPLVDGKAEVTLLRRYVRWLIDGGIDGIFALGTTGEGVLLPDDTWRSVMQAVTAEAKGAVPVAVQCGSIQLDSTHRRIEWALRAGADAIALLPPLYYTYPDEQIREYYRALLHEHGDASVYLYNIPKYANNAISPAVFAALSQEFDNVRGIKDSTATLASLESMTAARCGDVLTGSDSLVQETIDLGGAGVVSGAAAALPEFVSAAWREGVAGRGEKAQKLKQLVKLL